MSSASVKYAALMEQRIEPPMSEEDIRSISEETIDEIIGDAASPRFKQAIEKAIRPLLQGHLEVCQDSFH